MCQIALNAYLHMDAKTDSKFFFRITTKRANDTNYKLKYQPHVLLMRNCEVKLQQILDYCRRWTRIECALGLRNCSPTEPRKIARTQALPTTFRASLISSTGSPSHASLRFGHVRRFWNWNLFYFIVSASVIIW